jgi:peroxiredoxin
MSYYDRIQDGGAQLFAVSVDPPQTSEALRQRLEVDFTFLSDPDGRLLDLLNIRHGGGRNDKEDIAYPVQVLVDRDGIVRWTYESTNFRVRARPEEIFAALAELPH